MTASGQFALKTPAGFVHAMEAADHPVSTKWPEAPTADDFQFSAAEFIEPVERIRTERAPKPDYIGLWEDGEWAFWHFAEIEVIEAVYEMAA